MFPLLCQKGSSLSSFDINYLGVQLPVKKKWFVEIQLNLDITKSLKLALYFVEISFDQCFAPSMHKHYQFTFQL